MCRKSDREVSGEALGGLPVPPLSQPAELEGAVLTQTAGADSQPASGQARAPVGLCPEGQEDPFFAQGSGAGAASDLSRVGALF